MIDKIAEHPKRTKADVGHILAKAGLSLVPYVGGTAAELFTLIVAPPLEKRRDEWFATVVEGLQRLEEKVAGFKIENLVGNDVFVSAVLQASQIALRTHESEKLKALRNALLHTAMTKLEKEDVEIFYIGLIDIFTVTHIEILRVFDNLSGHYARRTELSHRRIVTDAYVMDLNTRGLLKDSRPLAARGRESEMPLMSSDWKLSEIGRGFLHFISAPYDA